MPIYDNLIRVKSQDSVPSRITAQEGLPNLQDVLVSFETSKGPSVSKSEKTSDDESHGDEPLLLDQEGKKPAIKHVYQGPSSCDCCFNWVDEFPEDLRIRAGAADETIDSKQHAILVRNTRTHSGPQPTEVYQVVIQSPILKTVLQEVIGSYPDVVFEAKSVVFTKPFKPLFHYWDQIQKAAQQHKEESAKQLVRLLYRVLRKEMKFFLKAQKDLVDFSVITFPLLWTILKPGGLLFEPGAKNHRMYRFLKDELSYKGKELMLHCQYVDWDGSEFGLVETILEVPRFDGPKRIHELLVYPQHYVDNWDEEREEILCRSLKLENLAGQHYRSYRGDAIHSFRTILGSQSADIHIDGRVMIDTEAYFRHSDIAKPSMSSIVRQDQLLEKPSPLPDEDANARRQPRSGQGFKSSQSIEKGVEEPINPPLFRNPGDSEPKINSEGLNLSEEDRLICVDYIRGFWFGQTKWVKLYVNNISNIEWTVDAFDNLILPQNYKDVVLSILEAKVGNTDTFQDFIVGKGKGVIMLLSGDPGVGKTLTAESVAEELRRPLYSVTSSELGVSSSSLESSLTRVLELSSRWNAVLLLDEADIFMEQRANHDVERNQLVSVFLRVLEYYDGVLLATSNRASSIDRAFKSRIDLSINYPPLSVRSQTEIWKRFVARSSTKMSSFTKEDWTCFAQSSMNGREIRNAVKLASLLAMRRKEDLDASHIREVLEILEGKFVSEKKYDVAGLKPKI